MDFDFRTCCVAVGADAHIGLRPTSTPTTQTKGTIDMKRFTALVLALIMIFSLGISAAASWGTEPKALYYRGISIYVDGAELIPQDVNGKSTEPFIINGTTYLPVRALAGALGLEVEWDGETNTITLTSGAAVSMGSGQAEHTKQIVNADVYYKDVTIWLDGVKLIPTDVTGKAVEPFLMGGSTYLPLRAVASALGLKVGWDETTNTITLDTPRIKYESLTSFGSLTETFYTYSESRTTVETRIDGVTESTETRLYTPAGLLLSVTLTDAGEETVYTESYTYAGAGVLASIVHEGSDGDWLLTYRYDDSGRVSRTDRYTGTTTPAVHSIVTSYTYDEAGRVTRMVVHEPWGSISTTTYSYDETGRLVSETLNVNDVIGSGTGVSTTSYSYDAQGRLSLMDAPGSAYSYNYTVDGLLSGWVCVKFNGRTSVYTVEYE